MRIMIRDVNGCITQRVVSKRGNFDSRENPVGHVTSLYRFNQRFQPIDETRLQTCPSIHLHWRPSVCRPLWYDLADAITTAAKPFLPEHHVSKDFSYRMGRSI